MPIDQFYIDLSRKVTRQILEHYDHLFGDYPREWIDAGWVRRTPIPAYWVGAFVNQAR